MISGVGAYSGTNVPPRRRRSSVDLPVLESPRTTTLKLNLPPLLPYFLRISTSILPMARARYSSSVMDTGPSSARPVTPRVDKSAPMVVEKEASGHVGTHARARSGWVPRNPRLGDSGTRARAFGTPPAERARRRCRTRCLEPEGGTTPETRFPETATAALLRAKPRPRARPQRASVVLAKAAGERGILISSREWKQEKGVLRRYYFSSFVAAPAAPPPLPFPAFVQDAAE